MRLLLGVILGVFLTIGFAYVHDASTGHPSESTAQSSVQQRPMVNWDVVVWTGMDGPQACVTLGISWRHGKTHEIEFVKLE